MNWLKMFPGRFLKSADFDGKDVTLTIAGVTLEDLPDDKGGQKRRGIMSFKETKLALVLNRTNATSIKTCFGADTESWIGKRVCFFPAPFTDPFTGEVGTAVRVRGSPDLEAPKEFSAKIGRKQVQFKLLKTAAKGNAKVTPPEISDADDAAFMAEAQS